MKTPAPAVKRIIKEIPAPQPPPAEEKIVQKTIFATDALEPLPETDANDTTEEHQITDAVIGTDAASIIEATPLYESNPPPHYPATARRRGYQGTVVLAVMVSETGSTQQIQIAASSGYAILDKAAMKAVYDWRFSPATRFGRPLAMRVKIPVQFILR